MTNQLTTDTVHLNRSTEPLKKDIGYKLDFFLWILSFLLGFLVICPISITIFSFGFGYAVEIPLVLTAAITLILHGKISFRFVIKALSILFGSILLLLPFVFMAEIRDVPFNHYYPDFRAILILMVTFFLLRSISDEVAENIIYRTSLIGVLSTAAFFLVEHSGAVSGLVHHRFSGQYFPPVFSTIVLSFFIIRNVKVGGPLVAILALVMMSTTASYRQLFLISGILVFALVYTAMSRSFLKHIFLPKIFLITTVLTGAYIAIDLDTDGIALFLYRTADLLLFQGADPKFVYQIFQKTAMSISGQTTSGGDGVYQLYLMNLFNLPHFLVPHGLGQASSIGDSHIWGANSIDNSIIFINYHFSFLITLPLLVLFAIWIVKSLQNTNLDGKFGLIIVMSAALVFLYFRAWPFVASDAALSFGMLLVIGPLLARKQRTLKVN